ncbi:MAG: LysR family transcriptional regulator [Xanthobacter sp.]
MFDLDLLRAFVSVVDEGGFTRAGARVHRTQSTVSQQVRRLEEQVGHPLLVRGSRGASPTPEGERLLSYARRILALSTEAAQAVRGWSEEHVRLGIPDDFAMVALTSLLAHFSRNHPRVRLSVRCALSCHLTSDFARGDLDLVLLKQDPTARIGTEHIIAHWPERLMWLATPAALPLPLTPVPLVVFPQGCLYRNRAIHALEQAGLEWRIAYESPNLLGLEAALAVGMGVSLLEQRSMGSHYSVLDARAGLPEAEKTELALYISRQARQSENAPALALAEAIATFCNGGPSARSGQILSPSTP